MANYVCPDCGATSGGEGRCRRHPAGERPRLRFVNASVYDPGEPPELYPDQARAHDDQVVADMLRDWQQQLKATA